MESCNSDLYLYATVIHLSCLLVGVYLYWLGTLILLVLNDNRHTGRR